MNPTDYNPRLKDETDSEIIPEVQPTYAQLRSSAIARLLAAPTSAQITEIDWVRVNGRRLTCVFYLTRLQDGSFREQFEYYDYRYFNAKSLEISV